MSGSAPPPADLLRALYEEHAAELLLFLRRLLGERAAAEDALQETFLRLHGALERLEPGRPARPYLLRVARNVGIAALRRHRKLLALEDAAPAASAGPGPAHEVAASEARGLVREALAALPPEPRAALVLRHHHGLRVRELAEVLGASERTARSRLRDAAALLEGELRRRGLFDTEERS
ncbi:MAG: RNA polymerase sigma factor [Planctomycetota bacterium]